MGPDYDTVSRGRIERLDTVMSRPLLQKEGSWLNGKAVTAKITIVLQAGVRQLVQQGRAVGNSSNASEQSILETAVEVRS